MARLMMIAAAGLLSLMLTGCGDKDAKPAETAAPAEAAQPAPAEPAAQPAPAEPAQPAEGH